MNVFRANWPTVTPTGVQFSELWATMVYFRRKTFRRKTLCWVAVADGSFRMTFYLADKAASLIADSDIPAELKEQFATGRRCGKIRGITVRFTKKADVQAACSLMAIKAQAK